MMLATRRVIVAMARQSSILSQHQGSHHLKTQDLEQMLHLGPLFADRLLRQSVSSVILLTFGTRDDAVPGRNQGAEVKRSSIAGIGSCCYKRRTCTGRLSSAVYISISRTLSSAKRVSNCST